MTDEEIIAAIEWTVGAIPNAANGHTWGMQGNVGHAQDYRRGGPKPVGQGITWPSEPGAALLAAMKADLETAIIARYRQFNPQEAPE